MDSFINKLTEGTTVKNTDYTVFDVANTTTGSFSTQKISYASFTKQLSSDITNGIKTLITGLETKINEANTTANSKLDKKGLTLNSNEKMSGTLSVLTLCATNIAHFSNTIDMHTNFISNVKDPILDQDAVTKKYLTTAINNINIPGAGTFLAKSGDTMTGGNLTLSAEPTINKHATTKFYVDQQILSAKNLIPDVSNLLSKYIPLSGGIMTAGNITLSAEPTLNKHATTKFYVDQQITSINNNSVSKTLADNTYIAKAGGVIGGTMTGSLYLTGAPVIDNEASNKKYVDDKAATITNSLANYLTTSTANTTYVKKSGDTMTGSLYLTGAPVSANEASNKKYVDDQITTRTSTFITNTSIGTTYVQKAGDTMTGSLGLKGFSEKTGTCTSTGSVSLNLSLGNTFPITLAGNITGFTLSNVPTDSFSITIIITQAATGGPYTVTFDFSGYTVKWPDGVPPTITITPSKTDIVCFTRVGSIIYAFNGGQNF